MKILDLKKYQKVIKEFTGSTDGPAVFVADYASYNEGHISGTWFDLTEFDDQAEFLEKISEFFKALDKVAPLDFYRPREETMFQDYQCFPEQFYCESSIDSKLWEYLKLVDEDPDFEEIFEAYEACIGTADDLNDVKECLFANIKNEYPDSTASTEEKYGWWCKENGLIEIPDHIEFYFDYEAYGRDQLQNVSEHNGYIFTN
jgi:antirestriction protein